MAKSVTKAPLRPAEDKKRRPKVAGAVPVISSPPTIPKPAVHLSDPEPELEPDEDALNEGEENEAKRTPRGRAAQTPRTEIHPTMRHLGEVVRKTRKGLGLTQLQLAQRCGFNSAAIFMVEAGRANMTLKSLMTLSAALELEVGDFFPRVAMNTSAKLIEVADTIGMVKARFTTQLQMLDRIAAELRDEAAQ
jgi:transcriptional regulator with XRE-family HTH domain